MAQVRLTGRFERTTVNDERVDAFVPDRLPPNPPLDMSALYQRLDEANHAIGRLDGVSTILPNTALFIYMYVRKEALLSSQIEGTQSSLSDILLFENNLEPNSSIDDVEEVSSYVKAITYGLEKMEKELPISARLFRDVHRVLMTNARGSKQQPGEFRRSQNWIGGTRPANAAFVPPPHNLVPDLMSDLEKFLHASSPRLPALIKAGLAHVQFETIHPFLDGNGRLGRLLVTLYLCYEKILTRPTLYLSLFLKSNRNEYYELLQQVRTRGAWEDWVAFFLRGVAMTSNQAADAARRIISLFDQDRRRIDGLNRASSSVKSLHETIQQSPIINAKSAAARMGVSYQTANAAIASLVEVGILAELTGRRRGRVYSYQAFLAILSEGTEPAPNASRAPTDR